MIDKFSQIKIPKKIKKRDGRIVDFEKGRVVEAVFKARTKCVEKNLNIMCKTET